MTTLDEPQKHIALSKALALPATQPALAWIGESLEHFVEELIVLSEIAAPTFDESRRATYFAERLGHLGIDQIKYDAAGNVFACLDASSRGAEQRPGLAFMAHLDTVFPSSTDVHVTRKNGRLYGPGIGDNASGLVGLLVAVEAMRRIGVETQRPIWVVASTGEEGLGDLKGARAALQHLDGQIERVVAIEGALLGRVTHEAVGSLRWKVHFSGPGGHSWHDFGRASAINAAAAAITELGSISLASDPRTTYNIGRIEGGIGVNVIAADTTMLLDMRSTDPEALSGLVKQAEALIRRAAEHEGVEVGFETVGDRPAGSIPRNHTLVETGAAVLRHLGIEPRYEAASTDANIPLSQGIPAITVGITHGGGIHTEEEWIDIAPAVTGIRQLLLLALALTG